MAGEGQYPEITPDEQRQLERELRALVPRAPRVDVAKLMYRAGQASLSPLPPLALLPIAPASRGQWLWPASTAVTGTLAAWLAVMLLVSYNRPALTDAPQRSIAHPHPIPLPVAVQEVAPPAPNVPATPPTMTAENATYLRERDAAIHQGVDVTPRSTSPAIAQEGTRATRTVPSNTLRRELGITPPVRGGFRFPW